MLVDYVNSELKKKERIVVENDGWVALVPFWAVWPYEVMILPKRQILRFQDMDLELKTQLADCTKRLLIKYDNLFQCSFPYSMGYHGTLPLILTLTLPGSKVSRFRLSLLLGAPTGQYLNEDCSHWVFHAIYYPPLLRSATVKKFMVGYEMLAQAQRDISPEQVRTSPIPLRSISSTRGEY